MKILIGSSNAGKLTEIREVLHGSGREVISPADIGIVESPHEEGATFQENALQKARFYAEHAHMPVLADDSGILVEALADELGIHTRRWGAGAAATDEEWISFFLKRMNGEKNRRARFVCCFCFIDTEGAEHFFEGACNGSITDALEAPYLPGLPISACFKPDGYNSVYSALGVEEKNRISHRGMALHALRNYLETLT